MRHKLKDIIVIVLFATLSNVDGWEEMEYFAQYQEKYLRNEEWDTVSRYHSASVWYDLARYFTAAVESGGGRKLKKIICTDGKTMRGNKRKGSRPSHIVSAWCREDGFCLGQRAVEEKSNEIRAIPKLIDAMGKQTAIAEKACKLCVGAERESGDFA